MKFSLLSACSPGLLCFFAGLLPAPVHGQTTAQLHGLDTMAPDGRFVARLELRSNGYDSRFNGKGDRVELASSFDQVNLNGKVFPPLALLGSGASLGTTRLKSEVRTDYAELTLGYGVSPDLTVGLILPYATTHTSADFSVSGGNVGFNPAFNPSRPMGAGNFPFAPVGAGVTPLNSAGLNRILTDPAFGYRYKALAATSRSGLGDPTVGALWRFYKGEKDRAVLGFGVRYGLAKGDDPDDLLDVPVGDGSTDIRLRLEYFRELPASFDLRLLAESKQQTRDRVERRVPAAGQLLATAASKESLSRDLGDIREYDIELGRRFGEWRTAATWHRYEKDADLYRSGRGTDTSALSADTRTVANQWRASLSWSGVGRWRAGQLPLPLILKFEVQDTYSGENFPKVRDYYLQVSSFF